MPSPTIDLVHGAYASHFLVMSQDIVAGVIRETVTATAVDRAA
jgi:hypothetical protein